MVSDKFAIFLRKARLSDVTTLLKLYLPEKGVSDFAGLHTPERFQKLIRSKNDIIIVAELNGKVAGALDAEVYKESRFSYFANLVVAKSERGKGIGSLLINEYERICRKRNLKTIVALVYDWNQKMHKVMRRNRYKKNGELVEYVKTLPPAPSLPRRQGGGRIKK